MPVRICPGTARRAARPHMLSIRSPARLRERRRAPATLLRMTADALTYRYLVPESNEAETDSARQRLAASPPDPGRPPKPHKPPKPPLGARRLLAAAAVIAR